MKSSPLFIALALLTTTACNLADKYCLGDCPDSAATTDDPGTASLGGSETGNGDATVTGGEGVADPAPTCDFVDTLVTPATCTDGNFVIGELCFVIGMGTSGGAAGLISMIALPHADVDLVVARDDGTARAMLYAATEALSESSKTWAVPGDVILTAAADFNDDGMLDVAGRIDALVEGEEAEAWVFFLAPNGELLADEKVASGVGLAGPLLFDDGDGIPDLLVTVPPDVEPENVIVLHGNAGDFTPDPLFSFSAAPNLLATGDLHFDGRADDMVFLSEFGIEVAGNLDGLHLETLALAPTERVLELQISDLDGDGSGDIVALIEDTTTLTHEVAVYRQVSPAGEPDLDFDLTRYTVHCGATAMDVADLDGDLVPDIAVVSPGAPLGELTLRRNDGEGGFADVLTVPFGGSADDLHIIDLNSDGDPDITTASRVDGSVGLVPATP